MLLSPRRCGIAAHTWAALVLAVVASTLPWTTAGGEDSAVAPPVAPAGATEAGQIDWPTAGVLLLALSWQLWQLFLSPSRGAIPAPIRAVLALTVVASAIIWTTAEHLDVVGRCKLLGG